MRKRFCLRRPLADVVRALSSRGLSAAQIATALGLSPAVVRNGGGRRRLCLRRSLREVVAVLRGYGLAPGDIAAALFISPQTARRYARAAEPVKGEQRPEPPREPAAPHGPAAFVNNQWVSVLRSKR